ncbi:MAG: peroxiredoxin [Burkholderiales bacterium]|nr:peroxiredoxin [Burkholderiales bacterium]ODU62277.1 MAG: peroxiredoxin [Lautropia sp. SCN 66-9]
MIRSMLAALAACLLSLTAPQAHAQLNVGDVAPDFTAQAALGGKPFRFSLTEALKSGPVVLYFFPKAFTQGCTIEANRFAEAHDEYASLGATVIGMSGDDIETLRRFSVSECRDKFAVAADAGGKVMQAYKATMPNVVTYARRISYVIGPDRRISYAFASGSPDDHVPNTLAAVRALKQAKPSH